MQNESDSVADISAAPFSYSHSTDNAAATLQQGDSSSLYSDVYGRMMPSQSLGENAISSSVASFPNILILCNVF